VVSAVEVLSDHFGVCGLPPKLEIVEHMILSLNYKFIFLGHYLSGHEDAISPRSSMYYYLDSAVKVDRAVFSAKLSPRYCEDRIIITVIPSPNKQISIT